MSTEAKRNIYKGHRYVPKVMGEWDKQETYEGLCIVTHQGTSYTSKKRVPVGVDILDEEYWVVTGNYNAQIEHYRQDVRDMQDEVNSKADIQYVDDEINSVNEQFAETMTNLNDRGINVREFKDLEVDGDFSPVIQAAFNSGYPIIEFPNWIKTLKNSVTVPSTVKEIRFNKVHLKFDREQADVGASYSDSMFIVDNVQDLIVDGGKVEYLGTFDFGESYKGKVCGFHVINSDNFHIRNFEATGFNDSGLLLGFGGRYMKNSIVEKCKLHHNRVAGIRFGKVDGLLLRDNYCEYNGTETDGGTGYGIAGTNSYMPKNVKTLDNFCNHNYRKGIDFHSGQNIDVINNTCIGNKYYGIYVSLQNYVDGKVQPAGTIQIKNNRISDMQIDGNNTLVDQLNGIAIGYANGQGNHNYSDNWDISGNTINGFTKINFSNANSFAYPFFVSSNGGNKSVFKIRNNTVKCGLVDVIYGFYNVTFGYGTEGSYVDVYISDNVINADEVQSYPYFTRGQSMVRNLDIDNETLEIKTLNTPSLCNYSLKGSSVINEYNGQHKFDNSRFKTETNVPPYFDVSVISGGSPYMKFENNVVNGSKARDWNGNRFTWQSDQLPTDGYWRLGSIIIHPLASDFIGWRKVSNSETNIEGTDWKKFGTIEQS